MQIIENKALLLGASEAGAVTKAISKSTKVKEGVLVHWGHTEAEQLAQMYSDVPSPILKNYQWTGKHTPFDHQKETASFISIRRRAFCFNEQGTGKTASVIWAADYLMKKGLVKRVLVLCPLSIMKSAWQRDLFTFAMHRSCGVAHGSAAQRKKVIDSGVEFVIINFDGLSVVKDEVAAGGFDLVVVDECFVAGTPVQTPEGPKPIETLQPGDEVFTSNGVMPVRTVKRRESADIVEVKLGNGERITCTGEHPFFTDVGWVTARNLAGRRLVSQFDMSCMRARVSSSEASMGLASEVGHQQVPNLLQILRTEEVAQPQSGEVLLRGYASGEAGEIYGVYEVTGDAATHILEAEGNGAQTVHTGRQRDGYDASGEVGATLSPFGVGMELPSSVGEEATWLSHKLQARLRASGDETGVGSGWWKPYRFYKEITGPEEGSQASGAWVESVSHIECGSGIPVFNLEVGGTPNYFVGSGWLVHNCTAYKNAQTSRWKVFNRLIKAVDPRLWMLTGTPAAQSPVDAYGLAKLVNPEECPPYFGHFRSMVLTKVTQFKWVPKPTAHDFVHNLLQPAIRFEKKDCLDLPEVTHMERDAPLTPQQAKYYKMLKDELLLEAAGEEVSAVNAATKINKLLQISGGAVYTDTGEVLHFDVSNRINTVLEVIGETVNKVLVFVPFTHTIELLRARMEKEGIPCEVINGKVSVNKRSDIVHRFQTEKNPRVLIIQPQAASHGLTLTEADTIIWYAPVTSVETYLQANARIDRPGQKNTMTIVHIKGSPVEDKLYTMLRENIDNHHKLIGLYRDVLSV
jgi:superfamily II DNA or RNA helicase